MPRRTQEDLLAEEVIAGRIQSESAMQGLAEVRKSSMIMIMKSLRTLLKSDSPSSE